MPGEYTHVGLFHYRCALALRCAIVERKRSSIKVGYEDVVRYLDDDLLKYKLKGNDVLLPNISKVEGGIEKHYKFRHIPEDWDKVMGALKECMGDGCYQSVRKFFNQIKCCGERFLLQKERFLMGFVRGCLKFYFGYSPR